MTNKLILEKKINSYIVEVSLNRPEKLNALTKPMWKELGQVFKKLSKNKNLRCIIIRGKGGKSFSPGNDISEFETQRSSSKLAKAYGVHLHGTLRANSRMSDTYYCFNRRYMCWRRNGNCSML